MRRIGKITGRSDDMLIIRGVNVPHADRRAGLENKTALELYEIHLYRNGNL
jgi:phenylacetate-CoA ligase